MRLILTRFRKYEYREFEFQDTGIVLLQGNSGAGKSTILNAILFVLYGKVRKPAHYGCDSCMVELYVNNENTNLYIQRKHKPNVLHVKYNDKEYDDECAQSVINSIYNNYDRFLVSSYIRQKIEYSILTLPPQAQSTLLENIVFDTMDHAKHKETLKSEIKSRVTELNKISGEISTLRKLDTEIKLVKPDKIVTEQEYNDASIKLSQCNRELDALNTELIHTSHEETKIEYLTKTINELCKSIEDIKTLEPDTERERELESEIAVLRKQKSMRNKYIHYIELTRDYEQEKKSYTESIKERIKNVKALILTSTQLANLKKDLEYLQSVEEREAIKVQYDKLYDELKSVGVNVTDATKLSNEISKQTILVNDIKNYNEITKHHKVLTCPCCLADLMYYKDTLYEDMSEIVDDATVKTKSLDTETNKLEVMKRVYHSLISLPKLPSKRAGKPRNPTHTKEKIQQMIDEQSKLIQEQSKLDEMSKTDSEYLIKLKNAIERYESEGIDKVEDVSTELDTLEIEYKHVLTNNNDALNSQKQRKRLTVTLNEKRHELNDIHVTRSSSDIKQAIGELKSTISSLQSVVIQWNDNQQYNNNLKQSKNIKDKIKQVLEQENTITNEYNALIRLKELCKITEHVSMNNTLNTINSIANKYLNSMFENLSIELYVKEDDTRKVFCKLVNCGMEYDSIDTLSGGERDRVVLAYTLAVHEVINGKLLMLDESLSSLDYDTNCQVLELLRNVSEHQLVLVISHDVMHGLFDTVIDIQ